MGKFLVALILLTTLATTFAESDFIEIDDYTNARIEESRRIALESYVPEPAEVADELNFHVHLAMENATRRELGQKHKKGEKCEATNPIDACWRCDKDWAKDRFKLVTCSKGFGRKATGGLGGPIYVVTDPTDEELTEPKEGTLRYGVVQKGPLWITFGKSMVIRLQQELIISADKTIDGRGANVLIMDGAGLTIQRVSNVIVHGIRIKHIVPKAGGEIRDSYNHSGTRTKSDGDAISIFAASNIWIDHCSISAAADGLIDVIKGSTAITISNCHMTRHNDVMLFGASDEHVEDKIMQVTVAFNHFGMGLAQRMPRCRFGFVHVVNNDYTHWTIYVIGGSSAPTILCQGNRFIAALYAPAKEVTHRINATSEEWMKWDWQSENDLFMNGATFATSGKPIEMKFKKQFVMKPRDGTHVSRLTKNAGALNCVVGQPC